MKVGELNMSKTQRLLKTLQNGNEVSIAQAITRFGFESSSAVSSAVRNLREAGFPVYTNKVNNITKYRIGAPSRAVVAAGYRTLGRDAYVR
jgi:hypothetical protein